MGASHKRQMVFSLVFGLGLSDVLNKYWFSSHVESLTDRRKCIRFGKHDRITRHQDSDPPKLVLLLVHVGASDIVMKTPSPLDPRSPSSTFVTKKR